MAGSCRSAPLKDGPWLLEAVGYRVRPDETPLRARRIAANIARSATHFRFSSNFGHIAAPHEPTQWAITEHCRVYSISSSAIENRPGGMATPRALAVVRLMTNSMPAHVVTTLGARRADPAAASRLGCLRNRYKGIGILWAKTLEAKFWF